MVMGRLTMAADGEPVGVAGNDGIAKRKGRREPALVTTIDQRRNVERKRESLARLIEALSVPPLKHLRLAGGT